MFPRLLIAFYCLTAVLGLFFGSSLAQQPQNPAKIHSQETSDDGIPVLIKHLPDWERVRPQARFATSVADLKAALGERPVLELIDFTAGTEAVTAPYDAGKLLIIEYTSPQASVEADAKFTAAVSGDASIAYRRIGNYNVLVFDVADPSAANALIDQVHYEKQIQWLGDNPFRISKERAFVLTTTDIFLSTVLVIVLGICFAVVGGAIAGLIYFRYSDARRAKLGTFTDAGGMVRLNLDGFTPEISPERLLRD